MKKLTAQEQLFKVEYLKDLDAKGAAIRAGYSETTAAKKAWSWVGQSRSDVPADKQLLWDQIQEALAARCERVQVDADYVLKRLVEIDQMDVLDILSDDGRLLPVSQWPKIWRQFIAGMDVAELFEGRGEDREQTGLLKKIKWPDKVKNLELLGRHVNVQAFKDNVGLKVSAQEEVDALMQEIANGASGAAGK